MKVLLALWLFLSIGLAHAEAPSYRFGVNQALPPFSYVEGGEPKGLSIDMAKAVFEHAGIRASIIAMDWARAQEDLQAGKLDGLIHINETHQRREWMYFSGSFLKGNFHFFTRPGFQFTYLEPNDLSKYRIALEKNGYAYNLLTLNPNIKFQSHPDQTSAIQAVATGKADVFIGEVIVAEYLMRELGAAKLTYQPEAFSEVASRIGISKLHPELVSRINNALSAIRESGKMQQIEARWNAKTVDFVGQRKKAEAYLYTAAVVLLIMVIAYLREHKLRRLATDAEIKLTAALKSALRAKEDKDRFIAQVTHEYRTPLNTIYGTVKLLVPKDEETREAAAKIKQSARQLVSMSNNILMWEKHVLGMLKPLSQIYSVRMLVDQLESSAIYRAKTTRNQWESHIHPDVPDLIMTDWQMVRRCLENLLDNAFKHCSDSQVNLKVESTDGHIEFSVKDLGSGITSDICDLLTQPYYQPSGYDNNRSSRGIGLGLAVAHAICQTLGGKLSVVGQPGFGTVAKVSLPLVMPNKPEMDAFNKAQSLISASDKLLKGYKILVVDDHELNLQINANILEHLGAEVLCAQGSLEAERAIAQTLERGEALDVIFMDLQMPEIDGFECIKRIRAQHPEQTFNFVALTACDHDSLYEELARIEVSDVLHKPFEPSDAVRIVLQSGVKSLNLTKRILANISTESRL